MAVSIIKYLSSNPGNTTTVKMCISNVSEKLVFSSDFFLMLCQLDFSCLKSTTENQLKSNVGKPLSNSMVFAPCYKGIAYLILSI